MSYPQGVRVTDTRTGETGVVVSSGRGLTHLVKWDDGGDREFVSVDYLTVGDAAPAPNPAVSPEPEEAVTVAVEGPVEVGEPVRRSSFTEQDVIQAIRNWHATHGTPPTVRDWHKARDGHPAASTVKYLFGTWGNAIEAAGYPRPTRGRRRTAKPAAEPVKKMPGDVAVPAVPDRHAVTPIITEIAASPLDQLLSAALGRRAEGVTVHVHLTVEAA